MKRSNFAYRPHTRTTDIPKPPTPLKYRIHLMHEEGVGFYWIYVVSENVKAVSPCTWGLLATASRAARNFREHLAHADECEIISPENHRYSGDPIGKKD